MRAFTIPARLRARAQLALLESQEAEAKAEALGAVVVMPPMDPPPTPPDHDQAVEGARAVLEARDNQLAALMAEWRFSSG